MTPTADPHDSPLLQEVKENYQYAFEYWKPIYAKGRLDMRAIAGDPWPTAERSNRKESDRLCLSFDELNQYLDQFMGQLRQNKRAVKVSPRGDGANDESAYLRAGIIRGAEYHCKAPAKYVACAESMINRSFGFLKIRHDYVSSDTFEQVFRVECPDNPETVLIDPDHKEPDGEDMHFAFELDTMSERAFREAWSKATFQSFTEDHMREVPGWITVDGHGRKRIQVAGYWKRLEKEAVYRVARVKGKIQSGFQHDFEELGETIDERPSKTSSVVQYITNGLEILDTIPWGKAPKIGRSIPIIPMFGKRLYYENEGGQPILEILSMVRLALEPLLSYCYTMTSSIELAGAVPKTPYEGYEGQFATQTDFQNLNRKLFPYAEFKATTEATGQAILALPKKNMMEPAIDRLLALAEHCRRAIQAAMGINGLVSGNQSQSESAHSGKALQELDRQESQGSFKFIDAYETAIERAGRIMDELLPVVFDTPREIPFVDKKDNFKTIKVNQPGEHPDSGEPIEFHTDKGLHGITVSTGPSVQSQRAEQGKLAEALAGDPNVMAGAIQGNKIAGKILGTALRVRDMGPIINELADVVDPPSDQQGLPPAAQAHIQQADQAIQALTSEVQRLTQEAQAKQAELDLKKYTVDQQELTKRVLGLQKGDMAAADALLAAQTGATEVKATFAHEKEMQANEHQHAQQTQRSDQEHGMVTQAADQTHRASEAEAARTGALEQQEQAAALAPKPTNGAA